MMTPVENKRLRQLTGPESPLPAAFAAEGFSDSISESWITQ
jgi:hypothetical protein